MTARRQFCPRSHDTFQVGRDSSYRCRACKREDAAAARRLREEAARAVEVAEAGQWARVRAAEREREYRAAIEAGGTIAVEAKWHRAFDEAADLGWGLCQWAQPNDRPGGCFRRTSGVYCHQHGRLR